MTEAPMREVVAALTAHQLVPAGGPRVRLWEGANHWVMELSSELGSIGARVPKSSSPQAERTLQREYAVLSQLADTGVVPPVIALVRWGADVGQLALAFRWSTGRAFTGADVAALGESLARLHAVGVSEPAEDAFVALHADSCERVELLTGELGGELKRWLGRLEERGWRGGDAVAHVHTDLHFDNLLMVGDTCILLDWEQVRCAHVEWDLAHVVAPTTCLWNERDGDAREWRAILARLVSAYLGDGEERDEALIRRVAGLVPMVSLRCFAWAATERARLSAVPAVFAGASDSFGRKVSALAAPAVVQTVMRCTLAEAPRPEGSCH